MRVGCRRRRQRKGRGGDRGRELVEESGIAFCQRAGLSWEVARAQWQGAPRGRFKSETQGRRQRLSE
jgi:hypothetical protein